MIRIVLDNGRDWYFSNHEACVITLDGRNVPVKSLVMGDKLWFGDYFDVGSHGKVALIENSDPPAETFRFVMGTIPPLGTPANVPE
jgi:hypothetical protein